jgi:two-component system response regulator RegA
LEAVRSGAANYLAKPIAMDALLSALFGEPLSCVASGETDEAMGLDRAAWEHIQRVLRECDGNITHAAKRLGIHRQALQRKLRQPPL